MPNAVTSQHDAGDGAAGSSASHAHTAGDIRAPLRRQADVGGCLGTRLRSMQDENF
jgi:hypothetical protein